MRKSTIYIWLCPFTGRPVYVGKTSQSVNRRMATHRREAKKGATPKHRWLANLGRDPRIVIAEVTTVESSAKCERRWVARLRRFKLLNARIAGGGNPGIGRIVWSAELVAKLGKVPDSTLAREIGCERKTVSYRRECFGIPASFDRTNNMPPPNMGGWNRIALSQDIIAMFGTEPDYKLAIRANVSKWVIARARRSCGIESYAKTTGNNGRIKIGEPHRRWT